MPCDKVVAVMDELGIAVSAEETLESFLQTDELGAGEKAQIMGGNARRLFDWPSAS